MNYLKLRLTFLEFAFFHFFSYFRLIKFILSVFSIKGNISSVGKKISCYVNVFFLYFERKDEWRRSG